MKIVYKNNSFNISYKEKYIYNYSEPKVTPESSDTVVEAGVGGGSDTAMFAKLANEVIGFEPSPRQYSNAAKKLRVFDNITLLNKGLWNESDELDIKYGNSGGDDGFLEPDSGTARSDIQIPVDTLENYMQKLDIDEIDFLKVEGEGAEPEIIEGLGELRPKKIAVNADEEREGEPVGREVMELLQPMGYNLVGMKSGHILFFTLESTSHQAFRSEFS